MSFQPYGHIPPRNNTTSSNNVGDKRLKDLKLRSLEKRRLRNDLALAHEILYKAMDLEAVQLCMFCRWLGLRRTLHRMLQQALNAGLCRTGTDCSRIETRAACFQKATILIHLPIIVAVYSIFSPIWSFRQSVPS